MTLALLDPDRLDPEAARALRDAAGSGQSEPEGAMAKARQRVPGPKKSKGREIEI